MSKEADSYSQAGLLTWPRNIHNASLLEKKVLEILDEVVIRPLLKKSNLEPSHYNRPVLDILIFGKVFEYVAAKTF